MSTFRDFFVVLQIFIAFKFSLCLGDHWKEAQIIMKRMSEAGEVFEGHDVAHVMLVEGQRKRHLVKRDLRGIGNPAYNDHNMIDLQLHLSSGSQVNLALRSAGIVDQDTKISYLTTKGRLVRNLRDTDCYSYGHAVDSSGDGWAAISHCDGLFGFAGSSGYDYFIHPVGVERSKRDTNEGHDVHVMWRRSVSQSNDETDELISEEDNDTISSFNADSDDDETSEALNRLVRGLPGSDEDRVNATGIVIELAMFSDAQYWEQLQNLYPTREDDFLLIRLAGAQALYSNHEKVDYDVQIKVKMLEYWTINPDNYNFTNKLGTNLRSFCANTRHTYFYDVHALNTGIVDRPNAKVGLAYVRGACTRFRCFVTLGFSVNQFVLYAHELGHTLGMIHFTQCPQELQSVGGFMGGGASLNFSPCMKSYLGRFLNSSQSNCLFRESGFTTTPEEYSNLPNVLPGQSRSPDELCHILAGPGYKYVYFGDPLGKGACHWWVCLNDDEASPEFGRTKLYPGPIGFPCNDESFCVKKKLCQAWNETVMSLEIETLRNMTQIAEWSEWSMEFSNCSRPCGTGVSIRKRECQISGYNLSPYCQGLRFQTRLCNTEPCSNDPTSVDALRQLRGDEVCSGFLRDDVQLNLKNATGYLPTSRGVKARDVSSNLRKAHSKSCFLTCDRDPITAEGDLDAIMPDGTPCLDSKRSLYDLIRFNIKLRCVRGFCVEFSDCLDDLQYKDECGVCGGDGSRCVQLTFGTEFSVPKGSRSTLATIPPGSTNVDFHMNRRNNLGVVLELWNNVGQNIIGRGGRYQRSRYTAVPFAGTTWSYKRSEAFIRSSGPTNETIVLKALRRRKPIKKIELQYVKATEMETN